MENLRKFPFFWKKKIIVWFDDIAFCRRNCSRKWKKITLFGTKNEFKSENNKPVVLRTTDGGESWEKREIDIDVQSASFDRIGERVYIVGFVDENDSVNRPVYVSNEDFKKWEYIGDAECEQIGKIHVNKNRGEKPYSIILERDNIPAINLGNLCIYKDYYKIYYIYCRYMK